MSSSHSLCLSGKYAAGCRAIECRTFMITSAAKSNEYKRQ
jgi:hypothetical protein